VNEQASLKLQGQRVVIVGGTSGMGRATAAAARREGASVIVAGRRPVDQRGPGDPDLLHEIADVTNEESVKAMFARVGAIDHLLVTAAPAPGSWRPFL
jgi:NAD(P)-dependent dehydrogenase (short-subunit alcohol dehydrogenase family)